MRSFARSHRLAGPMVCFVLFAFPAAGQETEFGSVRGQVRIEVAGAKIAEAGPVVAYLEPVGGAPKPPVPAGVPKVYQKDARFSPTFLAIAAGQSVAMPNDDAIYPQVFSYSTPKISTLGSTRPARSRSVTSDTRAWCAPTARSTSR